jgi:NAD(P)-dependent dehydrogenase (short-subunit alcohol dehydrogenase family)
MTPAGAVLVSGASTGIGAATIELLSRNGITAFAGVRNASDAARLAALHPNIRPVSLDVTSAASIANAVREVAACRLPFLGVVSNAGIAVAGPLETLPIDELRHQFEVNVFGALALVQAALPLLPEHRGRVVFVGSISGRLATPYIGPYSASKFALRSISDCLRVELAPAGIRVSLIEPGSVKTPIWQKGRDGRDKMLANLGQRPRPHYVRALETVVETTESEERGGMSVDVVAEAILHALTDAKPRPTYLLGTPARMGSIIAALPAALRTRIVRSAMRLP